MPKVASEFERIKEAYIRMATEAGYRPGAPGDGSGDPDLTAPRLDPDTLDWEASNYARDFIDEETALLFHIGVSNWTTNRALVFTIEAARLLCAGADKHAAKLLEMASKEIA